MLTLVSVTADRLSSAISTRDCQQRAYRHLFCDCIPSESEHYQQPGRVRASEHSLSASTLRDVAIDASSEAGIFFSGIELYHFGEEVVEDGYTYCNLQMSMKTFVVSTPLSVTIDYVVMSSSAVLMCKAMLAAYEWYRRREAKLQDKTMYTSVAGEHRYHLVT
eukprot:Clim_evm52s236 gene=Clim_evmTU52s236